MLSESKQGNDTISVTGSGKKDFVFSFDCMEWFFSKKSTTLKDAYAALDADREKKKVT
jgi:molybdopterin-guanine dinucleotide biosynthesis protein